MKDLHPLFSDLLPSDAILTGELECQSYGTDTARNFAGEAGIVLLPRSTQEVQRVVQRCIEHKLPIVPSGGRTGLCGGATATNREVVVSLQRMKRILEIQPDNRIAQVEAGAITQQVKDAVAKHGLDFPIHIASAGSSCIGGNIGTNAGGIHFIKYGPTRHWVLGVTVVTGTGEILKTGKAIYKDNSGYDLHSLFVGSEGTLGIITEATLSLTIKPKGLTRILCALPSIGDTIPLLREVRQHLPNLSAFEFFTDRALRHVTTYRELQNPFQEIYPCYAVIEIESPLEANEEQLNTLFMDLLERGAIDDVVIAQNSKQSEQLMNLREWISETLSSEFTPHKNDISVPVSTIPRFVKNLEALMTKEVPSYELVLFGHVGDGNIHLNWLKPEDESKEVFFTRSKEVDKMVFALVKEYGGSVSAEHGIGLLKKDVLHFTRAPEEIVAMKAIKNVFDPYGLMNPGKIFN